MNVFRERVKKLRIDAKTHLKRDTDMLTKVIFARPLANLTKHYKQPDRHESQLLDPAEEEFLISVVTKHADFVLSNLEPRQVRTLVKAMEKHRARKGEKVITQGDTGDYLYVVKEGTVRFLVDGEDAGTAGPGTVVGELALLYDCPRAATVLAETDCLFYRVSQETFRRMQASFVLSDDEETRSLLRGTKLFAQVPDDLIREMASCMFQKKFKTGEILVEKGETLDEIYFLKSGRLVGRDIGFGDTKLADFELNPGESFGARAVVMNEPCIGTAECLTDGVVYVLTKERFFRCLDGLDFDEMLRNYLYANFLVSSFGAVVSLGWNLVYCRF